VSYKKVMALWYGLISISDRELSKENRVLCKAVKCCGNCKRKRRSALPLEKPLEKPLKRKYDG
jgi:hypothetical protein